ncbi:MAG: outer membrane beta-barrel protein [Planctomycetota bacterium]
MKTLFRLIVIGCLFAGGQSVSAQVSSTLSDTEATEQPVESSVLSDGEMYGDATNFDNGAMYGGPAQYQSTMQHQHAVQGDCGTCNGCSSSSCGDGNCGGRMIGGRLLCGNRPVVTGNLAGRLGTVVMPWNRANGSLTRGCPDGSVDYCHGGPGGLFTSGPQMPGGGIFGGGCGPTPMGSCNGFSSGLSSRISGMLFRVGNQNAFGQDCGDGGCSMSFRNGRLVEGIGNVRSQVNVRGRVGQVRGRVGQVRGRVSDVGSRVGGRVSGAVGRVRSLPRQIGQPAMLRYISGSVGLNIWDGAVQPFGVVSSGFGGQPEFDIEESAVYRIAIGRYASECWRTEFEASYRRLEVDETQFGSGIRQNDAFAVNGGRDSTSFMFNLIRDLSPRGLVRPYLKAGIGLTYSQVTSDYSFDANDPLVYTSYGLTNAQTVSGALPEEESTEFSWQAGGGLSFCMSQRMFMDLEYQYVDIGVAESGLSNLNEGLYFGDGRGHQVTIGCRMDY